MSERKFDFSLPHSSASAPPPGSGSRNVGIRCFFHLVACAGCCLILIMIFAAGCRPEQKKEQTRSASAIEKTFERGPVKVVVRLDKKQPTIADQIRLSLEVIAEENYDVELPRFGDKLNQFGIVDYSVTPPQLIDGNRTRQIRSYELEPFLSGDYVIPPMTFTFQKKDAPGESAHELVTEEIRLKVRSLLPEKAADLDIHDIAQPVDMPRPSRAALWWAIGGALVALLAAAALAFYFIRRRRPHLFQSPPVPAHELAFRQLRELVAENLPEQGEIKRFYQRISDILRRYIEHRFGLHAPEQTTEEFLASMKTHPELNEDHRRNLREFLRHCDLVKFAEHRPNDEEVQRTFDACEVFITNTQHSAESSPPAQTVQTTLNA